MSPSLHSDDQTPVVPFSTASQRLASNRAAINAYRKNGEPRIVPLPVDSCDFNRNLVSPTSASEWAELDATIEAVRVAPDRAQSITPAPVAPPVRESFRTWPLWWMLLLLGVSLPWWVGLYFMCAKVFGWIS